MEKPVQEVILLMAADLRLGGVELGPESMARCNAAIDAFSAYGPDQKPIVVLGAGFAPRERHPQQTKPLCEMMREYLVENGIPDSAIRTAKIVREKNVWGSAPEIKAALYLAHDEGAYRLEGKRRDRTIVMTIRVVTSAYHAGRCHRLVQAALSQIGREQEARERATARGNRYRFGAQIWDGSVHYPIGVKSRLEELKKRVQTWLLLSWMGPIGRRLLKLA